MILTMDAEWLAGWIKGFLLVRFGLGGRLRPAIYLVRM